MNTPAAEVAANPAAVELLGDRKHSAGAAEKIGYEIALAGRGLYDALQQGLGLLGGEPAVLRAVSGLQHGDSPHIVHGALIGHDALVTRAPCTRNVTVAVESILLRLPATKFSAFVTEYPPALAHLAELAAMG